MARTGDLLEVFNRTGRMKESGNKKILVVANRNRMAITSILTMYYDKYLVTIEVDYFTADDDDVTYFTFSTTFPLLMLYFRDHQSTNKDGKVLGY